MNKRLIFNTVLVTFCLVDGCHRMWSTERGLRSDCVCSFWRCTLHHYGRKRMIHWRLENIYVYNIKITSCQRNQKKAIKLTSHTECIILIKWNASHSIDLWHICMAWAKWTWARCNDAPKHLSLICHTNSMMISRRNEEKALRRSWATHLFLSLYLYLRACSTLIRWIAFALLQYAYRSFFLLLAQSARWTRSVRVRQTVPLHSTIDDKRQTMPRTAQFISCALFGKRVKKVASAVKRHMLYQPSEQKQPQQPQQQ